jgi:iron complex transport system substrate-binding protein
MRIASLIPSGTDIAAELNLAPYLVGVSHACDHPAAAGLPVLTSSIIEPTLSPAEIDVAVSVALQSGDGNGSLYRTNRELLQQLQPQVILTQSICDVCAVNAAAIERDAPTGAQLVNLSATSFAGLWRDLKNVARVTGTNVTTLIFSLQARLEAVKQAVTNQPRPTVLVLEWTAPPFLGGHWVPEIVEVAGGTHLLGEAGLPSRRASWDEIARAGPEVLLMAPCGFDLDETAEQTRALLAVPQFRNLQAVKNNQVWVTNATHLFSRCTPASVRAVEVVAGILHPAVWPQPETHEARRSNLLCCGARLQVNCYK